MNAPGRLFVFADTLQQGPFGIFHVLLGDFAGHGTIMVGNVLYHLPVFFPRRCQAAGIVHGNRTEAQHLFTQIIEYIDEALVPAGMIKDVMKTDISIDDLVEFVVVDIFVDLDENPFQVFQPGRLPILPKRCGFQRPERYPSKKYPPHTSRAGEP